MEEHMTLTFRHPMREHSMVARVSQGCPAGTILRALQSADSGPFLPQEAPAFCYLLVLERTGVEFTADTTMADAGVVEGDVLYVRPYFFVARGLLIEEAGYGAYSG